MFPNILSILEAHLYYFSGCHNQMTLQSMNMTYRRQSKRAKQWGQLCQKDNERQSYRVHSRKKDMGADISSTMQAMLIEFCTKCYRKGEGGSIHCARAGWGWGKEEKALLKSMLPSKLQISQLFPQQQQLKQNPWNCLLNKWHETLTFSFLIHWCKAVWDNGFLCFPEAAY